MPPASSYPQTILIAWTPNAPLLEVTDLPVAERLIRASHTWAYGTDRISGVTIREAVRRLPPEDRNALLASYRS